MKDELRSLRGLVEESKHTFAQHVKNTIAQFCLRW